MRKRLSKQKGFTIIEILAVMAISAIIGGIILSLFISSQKSFINANNENIIQDEARMIVEFLENDLKVGKKISASGGTSIVTINSNTYNCSFATGEVIDVKYAYSVKDSTGNTNIYVYMIIGKKLVKGKAVETGISPPIVRNIEVYGTLTNNLETLTITGSSVLNINFKLKAGSSENNYSLTVTPRNL